MNVSMLRATTWRALLCAALVWAAAVRAGPLDLTVMTQNLYFGTDLRPIATATTPGAVLAAVTAAYGGVVATDPAARISRVAQQINDARPHIVGLQEAVLWRTRTPSVLTPAPGSETVAFDFVQMLLDDLGPAYALAIKSQGIDASAPGVLGGVLSDIRLTGQDAILVRTDLPVDQFRLIGSGSGTYTAFVPLSVGGVTIDSLRTFSHVDIELAGRPLRVITTHLEPDVSFVQALQGNELISVLDAAPMPQLVMGDFNSRADGSGTPTYANMLAAGFADAWLEGAGSGDGATCCQAPDLLNDPSALAERIDYVLYRGAIEALNATLVGAAPEDRTATGLWPSDHAGLLVTLRLVPAPGSLALLCLGLLALACTGAMRRRL